MRPALLISNSALTPARRRNLAGLLAEVARYGFKIRECVPASGSSARHTVSRLAPEVELVLVAGGDGTLNAVVSGLADLAHPPPVGLLPLGTGNDAARQLGLGELRTAAHVIAAGNPFPVDLIELRPLSGGKSHYAVNFAAWGFASHLLNATTPAMKRWLGRRLCYWVGLVTALRRYQPPTLSLTGAGLSFSGPVFHACAGNFESAGGGLMRLSPDACPHDGLIEFCVVKTLSTPRVIHCLPHLARGTHLQLPEVMYLRGTELAVNFQGQLPLALDGDVFSTGPVQIRVRPAAVRILQPGPTSRLASA